MTKAVYQITASAVDTVKVGTWTDRVCAACYNLPASSPPSSTRGPAGGRRE